MPAIDISDPQQWTRQLGLMPVPLYGDGSAGRFVMMNGAQGNFCLDISEAPSDPGTFRSIAWSADVGYYLKIGATSELYRWDTDESGKISRSELQGSLGAFQRLLEENEPLRQRSVISHAISTFLLLRSTLGSDVTGLTALRVFLLMLACAKAGAQRLNVAPDDWGLDPQSIEESQLISRSDWASLLQRLKHPSEFKRVNFIPELTLRHAAGQLFQEAHYAVSVEDEEQLAFSGILRPAGKRVGRASSVGIFFTPPAIARTVVEQSLKATDFSKPAVTIFDPACGSGEFLREALHQISSSGYTGLINLIGWDVSSAACEMATFALSKNITNDTSNYIVAIECRDSLAPESEWPQGVDVLLMNPPFVSWWDLTIDQRQLLLANTAGLVNDKPDLSSAFIVRSLKSLADGAVLGTVMPTSTLEIDSTRELRRFLEHNATPKIIARLGNLSLFASAMVDAAIFVCVKGLESGPTTLLWTDQRSRSVSAGLRALRSYNGGAEDKDGYSIYDVDFGATNRARESEDWNPRPYQSYAFFQRQQQLPAATRVFKISQGVATGLRDAFVLTSDEYEALPKRERRYFRPAVLNNSIENSVLRPYYFLFYPYDGETVLLDSAAAVEKNARAFYNSFLLPSRERLKNRRGISPEKWWLLMRPRADEANSQPKIVSTYYGQAGSFAYDQTGEYVVVQGLTWRFPSGTDETAKSVPHSSRFKENLNFAYLGILNSSTFELLLQATCRRTAGGQMEIAKRFLQRTPLPNLFDMDIASTALERLARIGRDITKGHFPLSPEDESIVRSFFV